MQSWLKAMEAQRARTSDQRYTTSEFISHHDQHKGSLSRSLSTFRDCLSVASTSSLPKLQLSNCSADLQAPAEQGSSGSMLLDGRRSGNGLDPNAKDAFVSSFDGGEQSPWSTDLAE